jgi:hypothetical protein
MMQRRSDIWAVLLRVVFVPTFGLGVWFAWKGPQDLGIAIMCLVPLAGAGLESERLRRLTRRL